MSGSIAIPSNVYNAVAPVAQRYGVPDSIWETVAYQESGFNTRAVGDNGTSFGLFQLHEGGQLPQSYYSDPQAVFDPGLNAQLAMPAIARAYQQSGQVNTSSLSWWEKFGSISGHPGGAAGVDPANINEARGLLGKFPMFGHAGSATPTVQLLNTTQNQNSSGDCCGGDFWCQVWVNMVGPAGCPAVSQAAGQAVGGQIAQGLNAWLQQIANQLKPELIKVGIFVLGLALFLFAWYILLHPGGQ